MDPTLLLRRIAYEASIDPRTILIPRVAETDNEVDRARAIETFALDELYTTYSELAASYVEENEGPLTADYIRDALTGLDPYVNFYSGTEIYMGYLLEELVKVFEMKDIVSSLDEVRQETSIIRIRVSPAQIESDIASLRRQRESIVLAATQYYEKNIAPIESALTSIVPVPIIDRSQKYMKTEATVLYQGGPLTLDSLAAMMQVIELNDRIFYVTRKVENDNRYLVLGQAAPKLSTELSSVRAGREDVLLLVVSTPSQKNREITINSSYSSVSVEDPSDLDLLLAAIPGLEIDSRVDTSLSSAITMEYSELYPVALYYLLQNYAPWESIMGVDDTQYKKKTISPLLLRYNRWPIPGIEEISRETLVPIQVTLSRIAVEGVPVQALVFSIKGATAAIAARTEYLLSRVMASYKRRLSAILAIYRRDWPKNVAESLLTQATLGNMRAGRELALLRPEIFGGEYQRTCDKKPSLVGPDEEGATEIDGIYIKCTDARTELGYKPRLDDPTLLVPCCIPTSKRAVINQNTTMLPGQRGYLFGAARLFGLPETQRKGVTQVARVGATLTLHSVLAQAFKEDKALTRVLSSLSGSVEVAPFKQSMWDYSDEQILSYLAAEQWDSDNVVDGIGLLGRVNIFVIEYEDDKMRLRVPRYKFAYYLPFYTDRPSIFIYRHEVRGSVIYENVRLDNKVEYIYKKNVSERSITIFQSQHITELIDRNGTYTKLQDRAPYSGTVLPPSSTQIIDGYGKLRGYLLNGLAHYYDSPSAPLAGPYVATTEIDEEANRKAFSDLASAGVLQDLKWHNLPLGSRLVSLPTAATLQTPNGPMRLETTWDDNRVREYLVLNRERQFILQLSNWIWSNTVNALRAGGDMDPIDPASLITTAPTSYNFDILPQELGVYDMEDALTYLQNTGFTDPASMSIVASSEGVRRGVVQMLSTAETTRQGDAVVPSRLVGLEVDRVTSRLDEGAGMILRSQVYLSSNTSLTRWISSERAFSEASVADLSDPSLRTYPYPFTVVSISKSKGQERWIVQNVQNGSYQRALQCCVTWLHRRSTTGVFNSGFTSEMLGDAERALKYSVIYSWNETGLLTPDVDKVGSSLSLLVYPGYKKSDITVTGHFAALLPLTSS